MTLFSRSSSSRSNVEFDQDIGQNVEREISVFGKHARIIGGLLGRGRGVEIAAGGFDLFGDGARRAPPRALERHVLEQMRQPMLALALMARADADMHGNRGGLQARHVVCDDAQAGGQFGDFDAHICYADKRAARARVRM